MYRSQHESKRFRGVDTGSFLETFPEMHRGIPGLGTHTSPNQLLEQSYIELKESGTCYQ